MSLTAEQRFWGDCCNTFHEEEKQLEYAARMGLSALYGGAHPPSFDGGGRSVVDIGGGPVSLLLKHFNIPRGVVVDPCRYPSWVKARYKAHGVRLERRRGEDFDCSGFDEAWIYNVLQHVDDPRQVVANSLRAGVVRIFEWIDIDPYEGHPNRLTKAELEEWLGGLGYVAKIDARGAVGTCFYGVFLGSSRIVDAEESGLPANICA